jgi:hypothetical protein
VNQYRSLDDANMLVNVYDLQPETRSSIVLTVEMVVFVNQDQLICQQYNRNQMQMVHNEMESTISN